jgi:hypothetical protein
MPVSFLSHSRSITYSMSLPPRAHVWLFYLPLVLLFQHTDFLVTFLNNSSVLKYSKRNLTEVSLNNVN